MSVRKWLSFIILGILLSPLAAQAGEARHVNFAAFQKHSPGFEFDPIVLGKFSDFIAAMDGAQVLMLSHTAAVKDGDVLNIQTDVLRDENGSLGDYGINCQMSFKDESTEEYTSYAIGGLCRIIQQGRGKALTLTAVIPTASLPDTAQGEDAWVELYEDESTGIAFYANVGKGK
jgi:hypothetical protein